jgi:maltose alpha-D-glucosyltransferase/alpha-amylase
MFLRLHDELTLEMVTPEDRAIIHGHYCKDQRWDFRVGEGISARLSELLDRDPRKIGLAYSIMLTLPGTPIIYYGDEYARLNDEDFYARFKAETGKDDTRYFVRGPMNWAKTAIELTDPGSLTSQVYSKIREQLSIRGQWPVFGRGENQWATLEISPRVGNEKPVLAYFRSMPGQRVLVLNNLSDKEITIKAIDDTNTDFINLFTGKQVEAPFTLAPYGYLWLEA